MRRALLLSLLVLSAGAHAQGESGPSTVLTASRALLILDPRLVVSQDVVSFSTSPSGRYLVAVQEVPGERPLEIGKSPPETKAKKIVVWDSTTGAAREISLHKDSMLKETTLEWFPGTEKALVHLLLERSEPRQPVLQGEAPDSRKHALIQEWHILDATSGTMRKVRSNEYVYQSSVAFEMSPTEPYSMMVQVTQAYVRPDSRQYVPEVISIQRLGADGRWGIETKLPDSYANRGESGWSPDGRTFQLEIEKIPVGGGRLFPCVLKLDPVTGNFSDVTGPVPSYNEKAKVSDVALAYDVTQLESTPERRAVATWWLKSTTETQQTKALMAEHASLAELPNGERFVVLLVNGALFTRQVIQLTLEQYAQMRANAARDLAMSNVRQVGLAYLMYAADYDGVVRKDLKLSDIEPYHKNNSITEGFVLVFPGGNLADVKNPANTVLGYVDGPDGRAVVYLDGHAAWEGKGG